MEFLKHLKEDRLSKKIIEDNYGKNIDSPYRTRFFEEITFNNGFSLSIQASGIHNSKPERTLADLSEYEAFEMSLKNKSVENFVTLDYATSDKAFSKAFKEYFDGSLYSTVPNDKVEEVFQKLKLAHGLVD